MTSIRMRGLAGLVTRTTARVIAELKRHDWNTADDLTTLRLPWYEVRSAYSEDPDEPFAATTGDPVIFIYDEIGGSLGVDANSLVHEIQAITAPQITVRINSPGGSVFDAVAIYNALNHHPANILVYVDSLAASAASVIAMAGDEIVMMPGSQIMIHDASAPDSGNADDHRKLGTFLDRQSDNIADIYRMRAGGDVDKWRALMLDETWAFAQESVDLGLADRIQPAPARPVPIDDDLQERMARSFDLSHYRYAGRQNAPAPGKGNHQHRATTQPRDEQRAATRAEAAEARKKAFQDQTLIAMPDRSVRQQTRSGALGTGTERRIDFPAQLRGKLETRQGRELYHLSGYATMFDRPYPMWDSFGEYEEVTVGGSADLTLARDPDVAFLVNHLGVTMARTTNGTLELSANKLGLAQDAWINPNRPDVQILMSAIDDELVTEMSFAFMIPDGGAHWSSDFKRFEIRQFDLERGDVSAVNYGANPYTSISARAREVLMHVDQLPAGMQRALSEKLGGRADRWQRALEPDVQATRALAAPAVIGREPVPDKQGRTLDAVERLLRD